MTAAFLEFLFAFAMNLFYPLFCLLALLAIIALGVAPVIVGACLHWDALRILLTSALWLALIKTITDP